jgi:Flp pilus assembly protein TadG
MRSKMPRAEREKGSAIVEGALIFLVLACMLIGTIDFGQFLFIHATLTERAREAVRYGSVNDPTDTTSIQNVVLYGQASGGLAPTTAAGTDSGIFNVLRSNVSVTATGAATDDYRVTVKIHDYTYHIYSPYMAGTYTGPIIYSSLPLGINF